jgi:hypothetical protein
VQSSLKLATGALVVGYNGTGSLTVANGGKVSTPSLSINGIGLYIGDGMGSNGTVTVTGLTPNLNLVPHTPSLTVQTSLAVANGALAVGVSGTGNLLVANGGLVIANGSDSHNIALYVGENTGATGNVTVSDVNFNGVSTYTPSTLTR